ncbi:cobaltochelatase CobT-related protein [Amycolatopsis minnesotensis]|uniref:Cobaltochelatase subunit CobT n=1 Tax=Amycolatopsis minnesotensis TaxID=337894 RepID=A0ABP5D6J0_9PSEU
MTVSARQAETRRRHHVEELCAAAIRALGDEPALHFRGARPYRGRRPVPLRAPQLYPPATADFGSFRGAADGMALRLTGSDAALHARISPEGTVERLVFELLEQFRVEAGAPDAMPGVVANLRHRFEEWTREFVASGLADTARGLLICTVAQICRARITAEPVVEEVDDLIEVTRAAIAPVLGHDLAGLRRHRGDQAAFAVHAVGIAHAVAAMLTAAGDSGGEDEDEDAGDEEPKYRPYFALLMDFDDDDGDEQPSAAASGHSPVLADAAGGYRVFTTAYDTEVAATAVVRSALLAEYRERLDRRVARQGVNHARLARELRAVLAEPVREGWDGGKEEGYVDGRALARLITSPAERRLFRTERAEPVADALVTFLIDCSGSMREHGESIAMLADVFARALELAGARCEILGFTTGAWNGGRAKRDWLRAGRPVHPGRLNERRHLVFKDAATPWRRAKPGIAALLKPDLFREGIDGEAVSWACRRASEGEYARRLLFVVSDGSPMDSATDLLNDGDYLGNHLKEVVLRHEQGGDVEVFGVGVDLDLSPYYRRSRVLDTAEGTGYALFRELLDLIRQ